MASLNPKSLPQCERATAVAGKRSCSSCEDHGELICLICRAEPGAPGPPGAPIEEAALEYKVGLPALGPFSAGHLNTPGGFPEMLGSWCISQHPWAVNGKHIQIEPAKRDAACSSEVYGNLTSETAESRCSQEIFHHLLALLLLVMGPFFLWLPLPMLLAAAISALFLKQILPI